VVVKNVKRTSSSRTGKRAVLLLFAIVILCGCIGQDAGEQVKILDFQVTGGGVEDVTVTAKMPEFSRKDRDFGWQIVAQPTVDITDFRAEVYDRGLFTNLTPDEVSADSINANTTKLFPISYRMGDPGLAEKTDIKMRSFYKSRAMTSTTVAVLNEVEYFQRKAKGTLGEIQVSTWSSTNPLLLTVSWSDPMPLLDAQEVQMYVDYQNLGDGYIEKLNTSDVTFTVPENLEFMSCDDYKNEGGSLILKRDLDLLQKRAKRSTCTFKAVAAGPVDSRSLTGTAAYNYEIDGTVTVPIIQK